MSQSNLAKLKCVSHVISSVTLGLPHPWSNSSQKIIGRHVSLDTARGDNFNCRKISEYFVGGRVRPQSIFIFNNLYIQRIVILQSSSKLVKQIKKLKFIRIFVPFSRGNQSFPSSSLLVCRSLPHRHCRFLHLQFQHLMI